ncbi:MAG: ATP-binding protein, partial [Campylobacterales bacterium]|nr:ATP-binding protein [Campylobacterales bacterium]
MDIRTLTNELGLDGLYGAYEEQTINSAYDDMPFAKRVQLLLSGEHALRQNRKIERLRQQAKLHEKSAAIEAIDFIPAHALHKAMILKLASGDYLTHNRNIILTGATGTGKSYIAQALANKAMIQGHSAMYLRIPRLMQLLSSSKGDDEYLKVLAKLKRIKLLILDDFGVSPLKAGEARDLLEITEDRTNLSSLIITSQLPIAEWHPKGISSLRSGHMATCTIQPSPTPYSIGWFTTRTRLNFKESPSESSKTGSNHHHDVSTYAKIPQVYSIGESGGNIVVKRVET